MTGTGRARPSSAVLCSALAYGRHPASLWPDAGVLVGSTVAGITAAALLLPACAK